MAIALTAASMVAWAVLVLYGCLYPPRSNPLPAAAERFTPPPIYREWWKKTEACAGRRGHFGSILWYRSPDTLIGQGDSTYIAVWSYSPQTGITAILVAYPYVESELVVRHEMLHALLREVGHRKEYFEERCRLTWETWTGT